MEAKQNIQEGQEQKSKITTSNIPDADSTKTCLTFYIQMTEKATVSVLGTNRDSDQKDTLCTLSLNHGKTVKIKEKSEKWKRVMVNLSGFNFNKVSHF